MTADAAAARTDSPSLGRRLLLAGLVVVPLAYASMLAGTVVHEVLGHGLTAIAVGGEFHGFVIRADGAGYARTSGDENHRIAVLAAGIVVTTVVGFALLLAARRLRGRDFACVAALVPALLFLQESGSYAFWGALVGRPPADFGKIVHMVGTQEARVVLSIASGAVWLAAVVLGMRELFLWMQRVTGSSTTRRALAVLASFAVVDAGLWMVFDWDRFVPGLARWPSVVASAVDVGVMALLFQFRRADVPPASTDAARWRRAILVSWVASALFSVVVLVVWRGPPLR